MTKRSQLKLSTVFYWYSFSFFSRLRRRNLFHFIVFPSFISACVFFSSVLKQNIWVNLWIFCFKFKVQERKALASLTWFSTPVRVSVQPLDGFAVLVADVIEVHWSSVTEKKKNGKEKFLCTIWYFLFFYQWQVEWWSLHINHQNGRKLHETTI